MNVPDPATGLESTPVTNRCSVAPEFTVMVPVTVFAKLNARTVPFPAMVKPADPVIGVVIVSTSPLCVTEIVGAVPDMVSVADPAST